jgi:hypothetical protein
MLPAHRGAHAETFHLRAGRCLAAATIALPAQRIHPQLIGFEVVDANIVQMQTAMQRGQVTSKELVLQSLARVAIYKDLLNPAIAPRISISPADMASTK